MDYSTYFRILIILVIVGFLPLCAYNYYTIRLSQRKIEITRIFNILGITPKYRKIYIDDIKPYQFALSVLFAMFVSLIGLCCLLLTSELNLAQTPTLLLSGGMVSSKICTINTQCRIDYQYGALMAYGMGFMGAYLWGLHNIFRRYSVNDLLPITFFRFGLRIIFSSVIALLIYHALGGFDIDATSKTNSSQLFTPSSNGLLLLTVFLVGMFPRRGLKWMAEQIKVFSVDKHPAVRPLPLEMIEGMTIFDKDRLEELGIDTCYDLATADFIPLLLKTPYGSRELIDWLLQAKLCVRFGSAVEDLRQQGFRTITDMIGLDDGYLEHLAKNSALTYKSLQRAARSTESDHNITRLNMAAEALSKYWEGGPEEDEPEIANELKKS